jgi:hypothetical protein
MPGLFDQKELRKLTPAQILELRRLNAGNTEIQNELAPADHYLFGKDVGSQGLLPALAVGAAAPAYYPIKGIAKKLGIGMGDDPTQTSDPSWDQLLSAYEGLGAGLMDWSKSKVKTRVRQPAGLLPQNDTDVTSGLFQPIGLKEKQMAFLDKLRTVPREQQLQFMAEQLSRGVPDTDVRFEAPQDQYIGTPEPLIDMLRAQRKKVEAMSRRPL